MTGRFLRTAVFIIAGMASASQAQISHHITLRSNYVVASPRDVWGYESNGKEYALLCLGDRLEIVDCTDPDNISVIRSVPSTSGDLKDVKTYQSWAYAINQFGPMQIINLTNPAAAFTQNQFATAAIPSGHNIYIDEDQGFGYVSLNGSGARDMRIIDLSIPTAPAEVGHFTHPNAGTIFAEAHDAYARNDTAYVSYLEGGFAILNVADKANPGPIALVTYPGPLNHNIWIDDSGNYIFTSDEQNNGFIRVWDKRDLKNIKEVAQYNANPNGSVHNVMTLGNFAVISYYREGVRILDIEDRADPIEVAYYDTYAGTTGLYNGCWGVYPYTTSGTIYASDRSNGLFVLTWDQSPAGKVQGTVTFGHTGQAAEGVRVTKASLGRYHITDSTGGYLWRVPEEPQSLIFEHPGFVSQTVQVTGVIGATQTLDIVLQPLPRATVVGTVRDAGGFPIADARVGVLGEDFFDVVTAADGKYTLDFVLADSAQMIGAGRWGYRYDTQSVMLTVGATDTADFTLERGYQDNFELDLGWTVGALDDSASSGIWERGDPVPLYNFAGYLTQPGFDFDTIAGNKCYFTGQAFPEDPVTVTDVDGGHTSLVSPFIDLSVVESPILSIRYWYVNNAGSSPSRDTLWFDVSADSGKTWTDVRSTRYSINTWWELTASLTPWQSLPQPLLFRVRAQDSGDESIIEAAIDAFEIQGTYPQFVAGDVTRDGKTDAADVIYLVNYVFKAGPAPQPVAAGDMNGDCSITSSDIIYLVAYVFRGGPAPVPGC